MATDTTKDTDTSEQPGEVDSTPSANHPKAAPIGKVSDALRTHGTKPLKTAEENQEKDKKSDALQPITSMDQLRAHRMVHGTPPAKIAEKENAEVKALEEQILKEGADKVRGSAASGIGRGKK